MIATKIWIPYYLNAHRIQRFLKTYRIQNFALIPPQPANENQDLSCSMYEIMIWLPIFAF